MNSEALLLLAVVGGAFIALCGAALFVSFKLRTAIEAAYAKLAKETGMESVAPKPRLGGLLKRFPALHGKFEGMECAVHCVGYGLDNTRQTDTAIRMQSKFPKQLQFTVTPKNTAGKLSQVARGKEVISENESFDARYLIKSPQPDQIKALLNDKLLQALDELVEDNSIFQLKDGVNAYTETGLIQSDERVSHWLKKLKQVASLEQASKK